MTMKKMTPKNICENYLVIKESVLAFLIIIFCIQLLKSGEVEVVERGEVDISLTGATFLGDFFG